MARAADRAHLSFARAQVDDDDLVAEAVHLGKGEAGWLCHAPLYGEGGRKHNSPVHRLLYDGHSFSGEMIPTWGRA